MRSKRRRKHNLVITTSLTAVLLSVFPAACFALPALMKWEHDVSTNYLSLLLAAYSLIVSAIISIAIYAEQTRDSKLAEKHRIQKAKKLMSTQLETALDMLIFPVDDCSYPFVGRTLRDTYSGSIVALQDVLTPEQNKHLSAITELIDYCAETPSNDALAFDEIKTRGERMLLRNWLIPVMHSRYRNYYTSVFHWQDMLDKRTYELLRALDDSLPPFRKDLYTINNLDGNPLFEYDPLTQMYTIWDGTDQVLHGTLTISGEEAYPYGIDSGWEKGAHYTSRFEHGKYHGEGCEYDHSGNKQKEGIYRNGKLIRGTEYRWILRDNGEADDDLIAQFGRLGVSMADVMPQLVHDGIDRFYVADLTVSGSLIENASNRQGLAAFLKSNAPSWLEDYHLTAELHKDD